MTHHLVLISVQVLCCSDVKNNSSHSIDKVIFLWLSLNFRNLHFDLLKLSLPHMFMTLVIKGKTTPNLYLAFKGGSKYYWAYEIENLLLSKLRMRFGGVSIIPHWYSIRIFGNTKTNLFLGIKNATTKARRNAIKGIKLEWNIIMLNPVLRLFNKLPGCI